MNELPIKTERKIAMLRFAPLACLAVCLCSCTQTKPWLSGSSATATLPPACYGLCDDDAEYHPTTGEDRLPTRRELDQMAFVQTASHAAPATIRVNDAQQLTPTPVAANASIHFTPASPREPSSNIQLAGYQQAGGAGGLDTLAMQHPDEYLFDGGDRAKPIHYDQFHRLGLDTEDTVAEYADHKGKRHVKASNRVAVYAPRFGAVRTVSNPIAGVAVNHASGAQLTTHGAGLLARKATVIHVKGDQADGVRMRSRASGLNGDRIRVALNQNTALAIHDKLLNIFENLSFIKTGHVNTADEARIAARVQAATAWTRDRFPVISGGLDAISELETTYATKTLIGVDDSHKQDGQLRIVKLADKKSAAPGDVITFTIRYDNLGDRPVKNIKIVDNLTTRLEYVDDSATSNRAGRLDIEDNREGSLVLKFVLKDPLPGHTGGFVTFQAKVR